MLLIIIQGSRKNKKTEIDTVFYEKTSDKTDVPIDVVDLVGYEVFTDAAASTIFDPKVDVTITPAHDVTNGAAIFLPETHFTWEVSQ